MDQQVKIDSDAVRSLAELLRETDLTEIEYQVDTLRIKVSRSVQQTVVSVPLQSAIHETANVAASAPASENKYNSLENHPGVIEAQMVGTVYLSPGPGANQFVSVGDRVSEGQTLFIIEAMKVMNMIKSPRSGTVKHIFVRDSQPVEYGDPVIIID
ncbi:MAG: acetyl-CoA carboxylase, biotin carboxyl carrier protein [Holosporaceae bacterium]|nr:acetyl-CoA carboxylase, biotin carboxyl carrier protein [Holosporaceae bacterium]